MSLISSRTAKGRTRRWVLLGVSVGGMISCGSRTGLDYGPPLPLPPECLVDADCPTYGDFCKPVRCVLLADLADGGLGGSESAGGGGGAGGSSGVGRPASKEGGKCVDAPPVECDDNDPCTADVCTPETGACHYAYATLDSDGDGYRAPRVGTVVGEPGSCGDDCDDTNKNAHPGGIEVCDGVDNDCNGIVDDNAIFVPLASDPVRVDSDLAPAGPGGLAYSGSVYASVYGGSTPDGFGVFSSMLQPTGEKTMAGEQRVNFKTADASGGPVVWTGDRFGLVWQDRRTSDYEIFFSVLGEDGGKKFNGDAQLTDAQGFSVNPSLAWNGNEFIIVWQDERLGPFDLFGQRVNNDGAPVGENIQLTFASGLGNESPSVAAGTKSIGVAWSLGDALNHLVQFQVFSTDLTMPLIDQPIVLADGSTDAVYPNVVWNKDRYVISWYDKTASPKAIYAAVVGEDGTVMVPPKAITNPGSFRSRYPFLRALGDRLLVVYADDRDQNDGYELYSRMISNALEGIGPEQRLTNAKKDSVYPIAAFGPEGNVGILFRDDREGGDHHVWFTRLGCVAGGP